MLRRYPLKQGFDQSFVYRAIQVTDSITLNLPCIYMTTYQTWDELRLGDSTKNGIQDNHRVILILKPEQRDFAALADARLLGVVPGAVSACVGPVACLVTLHATGWCP